MFDVGLVFNIMFTAEEVRKLPKWEIFDEKIMAGISALPAKIALPPRPQNKALNSSSSPNFTLWSWVACHTKGQRGHYGRRLFHLNPPAVIVTQATFTLVGLTRELAVSNPISYPDNTPGPQDLFIIGAPY
jgi:hypothetical protein